MTGAVEGGNSASTFRAPGSPLRARKEVQKREKTQISCHLLRAATYALNRTLSEHEHVLTKHAPREGGDERRARGQRRHEEKAGPGHRGLADWHRCRSWPSREASQSSHIPASVAVISILTVIPAQNISKMLKNSTDGIHLIE